MRRRFHNQAGHPLPEVRAYLDGPDSPSPNEKET